ncbi:MAG: DUF481 domain-containing protein [Rhodocyclaceae bacterium]|nr:DUF481 domain-containing protein [Rhodocyclaceae bacterium]MBX3671279.1 DUF481 domain-containing protein [Rhodocyclaceae bacterium]
MFIRKSAIPVLPLAMLLAAPVCADQIRLKNGDRLSGTILHMAGDKLRLRTTYAGEIDVRWSAIESLSTDGKVGVVLDDGSSMKARLAEAPERAARLEPGQAEATVVALPRIRFIKPTPEESGIGYHLLARANVAMSSNRGNSSADVLHTDGAVQLRTKGERFIAGAEANRNREDGRVSVWNWSVRGNWDHFFRPRQFIYAEASFEKDRFKDIRLRSTAGGGYGYQIYDDKMTSLALRGGLLYVRTEREIVDSNSFPALGWGLAFRHKLSETSLELFADQNGIHALQSGSGTVVHTRTGLRLPLGRSLTATAGLNVDWESTPAPGRREFDSTLLFGLGYALD